MVSVGEVGVCLVGLVGAVGVAVEIPSGKIGTGSNPYSTNTLLSSFKNILVFMGQPGTMPSMGTTSAAFRLERDVLSCGKIDLLFEEAAVNDASIGKTSTEHLRGMEGIVRHMRMSNPAVDIVMMHFVDPQKMDDYNCMIEPEVIVNHSQVADHYNIPTINLAREVTDRINNGEFTWEEDFKNLHPSPFGQSVS